jgi:hypothetical protein
MLVSDSFHGHTEKEKISPQKQNTEQVIIPRGPTMMLQLLDICINWPFKAKLKEHYTQCMAMMEHKLTPTGKIKWLETEQLCMWIEMHGDVFQSCWLKRALKIVAYLMSSMIQKTTYGRFKVLTDVRMTMLFFWVVTPCRLIGRYQHFG